MSEKRCLGCMLYKHNSPICEHCGHDERKTNAPHQLSPGTVLNNQYLVGRVLGQGGFGITYIGWDQFLGIPVAIKEFYPSGVVIRDSTRSSSVFLTSDKVSDRFVANRDRFVREATSLARLGRFSGTGSIVSIHNLVQANATAYIIMEYVDGSSIEDIRVNTPEMLSLEFMLELSIQLADALDYAWNAGKIIHRDIKPDNLLICHADKKLKLADLGLAGVNAGNTDEIVATPLYMAPEIAAGLGSTQMTSDIYSFGVMFYELSSGVPPFTGSIEELQRAHLEDIPEPLLVANPDLDPELARYIDSMLAKNPAERPQSWSEIKERLTAIKERLYSSQRYILPQFDERSKMTLNHNDGQAPRDAKWAWAIFAVILLAALLTVAFFLIF